MSSPTGQEYKLQYTSWSTDIETEKCTVKLQKMKKAKIKLRGYIEILVQLNQSQIYSINSLLVYISTNEKYLHGLE